MNGRREGVVSATEYTVGQFTFVLACGHRFRQPAPSLASEFELLLEGFMPRAVADTFSDPAEGPEAAFGLPALPHPFRRSWRDAGPVACQFMIDSARFTWRAGSRHLFVVEDFASRDDSTRARQLAVALEPLVLDLASLGLRIGPHMIGVCLERDGKRFLFLGPDSDARRKAWVTLVGDGGFSLVSNHVVAVDARSEALIPFPRLPRLASDRSGNPVLLPVSRLISKPVPLPVSVVFIPARARQEVETDAILAPCNETDLRLAVAAVVRNARSWSASVTRAMLANAKGYFLEEGSVPGMVRGVLSVAQE